MSDRTIKVSCPDFFSGDQSAIERFQYATCRCTRVCRARDAHNIAMCDGLDTKAVLNQRKMSIILAKQMGKQPVVLEWNIDLNVWA